MSIKEISKVLTHIEKHKLNIICIYYADEVLNGVRFFCFSEYIALEKNMQVDDSDTKLVSCKNYQSLNYS